MFLQSFQIFYGKRFFKNESLSLSLRQVVTTIYRNWLMVYEERIVVMSAVSVSPESSVYCHFIGRWWRSPLSGHVTCQTVTWPLRRRLGYFTLGGTTHTGTGGPLIGTGLGGLAADRDTWWNFWPWFYLSSIPNYTYRMIGVWYIELVCWSTCLQQAVCLFLNFKFKHPKSIISKIRTYEIFTWTCITDLAKKSVRLSNYVDIFLKILYKIVKLEHVETQKTR